MSHISVQEDGLFTGTDISRTSRMQGPEGLDSYSLHRRGDRTEHFGLCLELRTARICPIVCRDVHYRISST